MARRSEPQPAFVVDLHGSNREQARRRVLEALARARATGASPILVVTGRGFGSAGGTGVLRDEVARLLRGPQGRAYGVAEVRPSAKGGAWLVTVTRPAS